MTPLQFIGLFTLLAIVLLFSYWYCANWQERCEREFDEYDTRYKIIQYHIRHDLQTPENYSSIERMIESLNKLPYRSKEKTRVLWNELWINWTPERLRRVKEITE